MITFKAFLSRISKREFFAKAFAHLPAKMIVKLLKCSFRVVNQLAVIDAVVLLWADSFAEGEQMLKTAHGQARISFCLRSVFSQPGRMRLPSGPKYTDVRSN